MMIYFGIWAVKHRVIEFETIKEFKNLNLDFVY